MITASPETIKKLRNFGHGAGVYLVKPPTLRPAIIVLPEVDAEHMCWGHPCANPKPEEEGFYKLPKKLSADEAKALGMHSTWQQHKNWKQQAYGGVLVNKDGLFLLREPSHHFDGYSWTFAKGKMDSPDEHPVDTALREVLQETGRDASIIDQLPGTFRSGSGSHSNYYLMRSNGFNPDEMDTETWKTKWVDFENAKKLIGYSKNGPGKMRDLWILHRAKAYLDSKYGTGIKASIQAYSPEQARDNDGKWTSGPGGGGEKQTPHGVLTKQGWKKVSENNGILTYKHYKHGTIEYKNNFYQHKVKHNNDPANFKHIDKSGNTVTRQAVGQFGKNLAQHLGNLGNSQPAPAQAPNVAPIGLGTPKGSGSEPSGPKASPTIGQPPPNGMAHEYETGSYKYKWNSTKGLYDQHLLNTEEKTGHSQSVAKIKNLQDIGHAKPVSPTATQKPQTGNKPTGEWHGFPSMIQSKLTGHLYTFDHAKNAYVHVGNKDSLNTGKQLNNDAALVKKKLNNGAFESLDPSWKKADLQKAGKPQSTPVTPKASEFTYVGSATHLGGAHDKALFTDQKGDSWLFKPAESSSGQKQPMMAQADDVASKIAMKIRPESAVEAKAVTLNVPGKGETLGSIQKMVNDIASPKDFKGTKIENLTPPQVKAIQQEQVVDWLISNHDSHGGQFLKTNDGKILGIDKTQAFKYFGSDKLDPNYHPNAVYGEAPPIYNDLWKAVKAGNQTFDPQNSLPTIKKAMAISDTDYKGILKPYADARYGTGDSADKSKFIEDATARKNNLKSDFEKLYSNVQGTPFKFDESKLYSPLPPKGGVTEELHHSLEDAGYKFEKYGAKTGFALYKENGDHVGKAVYVTDPATNKWSYYPMGTQGTNPYGASEGTGIETLKHKLTEPFEKPAAVTPSYESPSYSTSEKGLDKLSPEAKALHAALPDVPVSHAVNGDPVDLVDKKGKFTHQEQTVLGDYKGSGYGSINGYLYNGGEAAANDKTKHLDSAVAKCKTNQSVIVWRNMGSSQYANNLRNYLLEEFAKKQADPSYKVMHEPSCFQSSSTSQQFAHNWSYGPVVMQISLPKGSPAIPWNSEHELMLDRTVVYNVNKLFKSGGKLYADCNVSFKPKNNTVTSMAANKTDKQHSKLIKALGPVPTSEEYAKKLLSYDTPEAAELGMSKFLVNGVWVGGDDLAAISGWKSEQEPPKKK